MWFCLEKQRNNGKMKNRKRKYAGCGNVEAITCACEFGKL